MSSLPHFRKKANLLFLWKMVSYIFSSCLFSSPLCPKGCLRSIILFSRTMIALAFFTGSICLYSFFCPGVVPQLIFYVAYIKKKWSLTRWSHVKFYLQRKKLHGSVLILNHHVISLQCLLSYTTLFDRKPCFIEYDPSYEKITYS